MNQFTFEGRQKSVLLGGIAIGVVCMIMTFFMDDAFHTRFWSNFLHNTVFFTGIAFISLFVLAAFTVAYAGWHTVVKRIWEAYSLFLIPGLILMLVVIAGVWGHFHHLYHWAADGITDPESPAYDAILAGKSGFLNKGWYTLGTLVIVGVWILFALRIRRLSLLEDEQGTPSYAIHRSIKKTSAILLPIAAFSSAAIIWQWVMSIDAHWYSTLFAWYCTASWFVSAMALTILMLIYLKSKGYFQNVTDEHIHDIGKYIFGFSVFWAYLWFSQFMLIWYGNVGEETTYFLHRREHYPVLFYGNLVINFVLPFLILMPNYTKRKFGTIGIASLIVFVGHWIDYFLMIKPGALHTAQEAMAHAAEGGHGHEAAHILAGFTYPGILELGTFIGFLSLFIYFTFSRMTQASLEPKNDPYLTESLHHHV